MIHSNYERAVNELEDGNVSIASLAFMEWYTEELAEAEPDRTNWSDYELAMETLVGDTHYALNFSHCEPI